MKPVVLLISLAFCRHSYAQQMDFSAYKKSPVIIHKEISNPFSNKDKIIAPPVTLVFTSSIDDSLVIFVNNERPHTLKSTDIYSEEDLKNSSIFIDINNNITKKATITVVSKKRKVYAQFVANNKYKTIQFFFTPQEALVNKRNTISFIE